VERGAGEERIELGRRHKRLITCQSNQRRRQYMNEIQIEEEKEIEGELEELEVEEKARTIYVDKRDWPIDAICNRIQQGELELQPEFQRQYVWDDKRASLFVESILMGLPTPVIYLAEDQEGKLLTIDGQQRLKSIYRFWRNEFALRGLTVFKEFNPKLRKN